MTSPRTTWNFYSAGQLLFGFDAIQQLPCLLIRRQWASVFLVTDRRLVDAGIVEAVASPLREARIAVTLFDEGEAEPSIDVALRAAEAAKRCRPAVVLGLGGGSNMDLAKITALLATHGGHPSDYFGWDRVPGPVLPLACVPTTAGTGSEVSHAAVLTDVANKIKVSTLSNYLRPALAVVDPGLTMTCPKTVKS